MQTLWEQMYHFSNITFESSLNVLKQVVTFKIILRTSPVDWDVCDRLDNENSFTNSGFQI